MSRLQNARVFSDSDASQWLCKVQDDIEKGNICTFKSLFGRSLSNFLLGLLQHLRCGKHHTPITADLDVVDMTINGVLIWGEND